MFRSLDTLSPTWTPSPVNRQHPLNRGRVAWWLALPHLVGGNKFYDLMGLRHASYVNPTSSNGWRGTTRPGGFAHVLLNTSPYFNVANPPTGSVFTVHAWVRPSAFPTDSTIYAGGGAVGVYIHASKLGWENGGAPLAAGATALIAQNWYFCCYTYDGTTLLAYLNGVQDGSQASGGLSLPTTTVRIGNDTFSDPFAGSIDDVGVLGRCWSAPEVFAYYNLSRLGYPGVLNRMAMGGPSGSTPAPLPAIITHRANDSTYQMS